MSYKNKGKESKKMQGKPFDEYRCFYIKDFRKGDSIRVSLNKKEGTFQRGVVTDVDLQNCLIHYRTAQEDDVVTTINNIISLEGFSKNFLDN